MAKNTRATADAAAAESVSGEPLNLSDAERAALPKLEPLPEDQPAEYAVGVSDVVEPAPAPAPAPAAEPVMLMSLDEFGEALSHLIRSPTLNNGFRRVERDAGRLRDTHENFLARFEAFRGAKPGERPAKA